MGEQIPARIVGGRRTLDRAHPRPYASGSHSMPVTRHRGEYRCGHGDACAVGEQ